MTDHSIKSVTVVGLGYIGLPTAAVLANHGYHVSGCDVSPSVVDSINQGEAHLVEKDLDLAVSDAVKVGRLVASIEPAPADVFIIAVPTPFKGDHQPDLSYVEAAVRNIAPILTSGNSIILESTSPVGTTQKVMRWIFEERPDLRLPSDDDAEIAIAYCPERVLPGKILKELIENDRLVGGLDDQSSERIAAFYRTFVTGDVVTTTAATAELAKLTENAFRDVNIAFANELSGICDRLEIDVWELIGLANRHPRVNVLQPGPGVGGHCIAVDPWFIVDSCPEESTLIHTARLVNDQKPRRVASAILREVDTIPNATIALLGMAYKPNIDDCRESPAIDIAELLLAEEAGRLLIVEPHITELPKRLEQARVLLGAGANGQSVMELADMEQAIDEADLVVLLVPHKDFVGIDRSCLAGKRVMDACGGWR